MRYKEITVYTKNEAELAALVERLSELGFDQLVINDPADAEALSEESWGYTGSYVDKAFIEELKSKAYAVLYLGSDEPVSEKLQGLLKSYDHSISTVDDQDWLHKWEECYVPFEIAPGIVVRPVWRGYEVKPGELVVSIDPGLAFGTGSSPTTYLATRLMQEYLRPGDSALDVGCGTGIQSLIASELGAAQILAVDYDPEAVASTAANAALNGCENIEVRRNDLVKGLDVKADLIVANLTGPLVVKLCEDVAGCCRNAASDKASPQRGTVKAFPRRGTVLIASGIIDDMEEPCVKAMQAAGFMVLKVLRDDCWVAVAAEYCG